MKSELDSLKQRMSALEAMVRVLLARDGTPTTDRSSAYTDADAEKAKEAAEKYISRRRDELHWGEADAGG